MSSVGVVRVQNCKAVRDGHTPRRGDDLCLVTKDCRNGRNVENRLFLICLGEKQLTEKAWV